MTDDEMAAFCAEWETVPTPLLLSWAARVFGERIVVSSSFQTQSVPLLHMLSRVCPTVPVLFLDTGYHFPETLTFCDELRVRFALNIRNCRPLISSENQREKHGELWRSNPGMCCYLNKVEPLRRELEKVDIWITGIRHDQTNQRRDTKLLGRDSHGLLKLCPMVHWNDSMIERYIDHYDLPRHPLHQQGYLSVGCAPCTSAIAPGEDPRSGRWKGSGKTECGIHFDEQGILSRNKK